MGIGEMQKEFEEMKNAHKGVCPDCGRCPTCGKRYNDDYYTPYPWQTYPPRWWNHQRPGPFQEGVDHFLMGSSHG